MNAIHKVVDIVRLGLYSVAVHKVRSGLTALGILFGVWSVIAMLAISEGAARESQLALRKLGSDNIIIESVKPPQGNAKASSNEYAVMAYGLKHADVARLRDNIPNVVQSVVVHRTLKYAHYAEKNLSVSVIGTEPSYMEIARADVKGRFIKDSDILRGKPYCVITTPLARKLYTFENPLGKTLRLSGEPFIIVGVLDRLPLAMAGPAGDVGDYVIIPLTSARRRFGKYTIMWSQGTFMRELVEISQLILKMKDENAVIEGAAIARSLLERFHDEMDYHIVVPLELIEQRKQQMRLWNFMFMTIASVSLLVGGIGIMNIMLASVTERTREIGIRRALGAKRRDIVIQFLVESITLTTVGGLLGIGIGVLVPKVVEKMLGFTTVVSPLTLMLPFVMAVAVGLVSGLYPALRASRLDPIEALRHE